MAKIFLDPADSITISNNNVSVFGSTGTESVTIAAGVTGTVLDQNTEKVLLSGAVSSYKFVQAGNQIKVYNSDGTTLVATVPVQGDADGTALTFSDGTAQAKLTSGVMSLGGATVGATAAVVTPTTFDTTVKTPGTTTASSFSVAAGATSVIEGNNATFTVSLSTAQSTATTVNFAVAGTGGATIGTDTGTVTATGATLSGSTLTFPAGVVTATVTVPVTFDTTAETGEGITLTLSSPSTGASLGTATASTSLTDPTAPTFTLTSNATAGQSTEEGKTITYTITPSGITDKAYTFTLSSGASTAAVVGATAAASADFTPASTTITFAAGTSAAQTVVQTVYADGTTEGLESYSTVLLDSNLAAVATLTGLISDATGGTATGSTYSLTTGADVLGPNSTTASLKTTTGGDSIFGLTDQSLTSADIIDAGTGDDVLTAAYATAATLAPVLTSVEKVVLRQSANAATAFDAANSTGLTNLTFDAITESGNVTAQSATNLGSSVTSLGITNVTSADADTFTFTYTDAALAGTADSLTLNVTADSGTASGVVVIRGTSSTAVGAGAETLNIVTSGTGSAAASKLASVLVADGGGATSTLKTLNVSGTSNLTITGSVDFAGTTGGTISATGQSGNLTLTATTGNEPITFTGGTGKNTITVGNGTNVLTGGSNDDTFNLGTGTDSVTGGAGNDTVSAAIASYTAADKIALGDGTRDAVIYTGTTALNSTGVVAADLTILNGYTGVEVVGSSAAVTAVDAGYFTQTVYKLTGALTAAVAVTNVASDTLILTSGITGVNADALTVSGALPNQILNLELGGAAAVVVTATDGGAGNSSLTVASGISTVNILSNTTSTTAVTNAIGTTAYATATETIDNVSAGSFVLTGATDFTIFKAATAGFTKAVDFNASAFTGKLTIAGSNSADVIKGGTGNDVIAGLKGGDVLTGGTGANAFTFTAVGADFASGSTVAGLVSDSRTITDWKTGVGNTIDFGATTLAAVAHTATAVSGTASVSSTGLATFNSADNTLALKLTAVFSALSTDAVGTSVVFNDGSNAYVAVVGNATAGVDAIDGLIQLTGVTVVNGLTFAGGDINGIA